MRRVEYGKMSGARDWSVEMANATFLESFRLKSFKAVRDSGVVELTPLTVLIGNNGTGKSSFVEGMHTYQKIVADGLDKAMQAWLGFEYVTNPPMENGSSGTRNLKSASPIEFELSGIATPQFPDGATTSQFETFLKVNKRPNSESIFIEKETVDYGSQRVLERDSEGVIQIINKRMRFGIRPGDAIISNGGLYFYDKGHEEDEHIDSLMGYGIRFDWQFVTLNPWLMGGARLVQRTAGPIQLQSDGSNIAEYLHHIFDWYPEIKQGILESLRFVLPYMRDLEPVITDTLGRQIHLVMTEKDYKVPGWLLSTGTLRLLALLALFRHPDPPPLIVIEEIENGLDPRSVQLIVEEIRRVTESGHTQVILTSHSPYLLDLFDLSHVILVERMNGETTFTRPDERGELDVWKERFGPGRLFSSGRLRNRELA